MNREVGNRLKKCNQLRVWKKGEDAVAFSTLKRSSMLKEKSFVTLGDLRQSFAFAC